MSGLALNGMNASKIARLHSRFVCELRKLTAAWLSETNHMRKQEKKDVKVRSNRSFVSKYLHFHLPNAFPILDSVAVAGLRENEIKVDAGNYEKYCQAILRFANDKMPGETLRAIDHCLYADGRRRIARTKNKPCHTAKTPL